ncbi:hypothetical protein KFK09_006458 [Dendrobium nobile]|uniref:F-box protein n=1 Tax=Dendrobium nobile TaxID=94219 RepID=A0A8T3BRP7_DENNO|nr:hypothetical protein KFK09_006458 [Dendrobium nobile]
MTWSDLPVDLLHCISSYLHIVDFLYFSGVCTSWNLAVSNNALLGIHCSPSPWLLLPSDVGEASDTLTFHDLTIQEEEEDGVNIHYRFSSLTDYIFGRRCIGSKDGWLVTLDKMDMQPRIFNPLTKAEISLPSLFTIPEDKEHRIKLDESSEFYYNEIHPNYATDVEIFRDVYFRKIVMSSNDQFGTAVVIYGYIKLLALLRPNDKAWVLGPSDQNNKWVNFEDVYYHEEEHRFYAITHFSAVLAFDLSGQNVEFICPRKYDEDAAYSEIMNYIAFLFGNLIKIEREVEYVDLSKIKGDESMTVKTIRISIFKLLPDAVAWIPIKDLGDFSLFIGCNQTFSLHHTVAPGIRRNCVYFTDHVENMSPDEVTRDAGYFDLHSKSFHYFLDSDSQPNWPPSIWFLPSFS